MYLEDGREIYECDQYPGHYIDANTGAFCDSRGNYIGGNIDNGDKPGGSFNAMTYKNIFNKRQVKKLAKRKLK